jgi:hypothetical protein
LIFDSCKSRISRICVRHVLFFTSLMNGNKKIIINDENLLRGVCVCVCGPGIVKHENLKSKNG